MLTLARCPGESIKIGDDIKITVTEILISEKKTKLTISNTEIKNITLASGQNTMITDNIKMTIKSITN